MDPHRDQRVWGSDGRRQGFEPVHQGWNSSNFSYRHYGSRYGDGYAPSPWYRYGSLPAYISISLLIVADPVIFSWGSGSSYAWSPHRHYDNVSDDRAEVDACVDDISDGFALDRPGNFDRILPSGQYVSIEIENQRAYEIPDSDFRLMMNDVVGETSTLSYSIDSVWRNGDDVTVVGIHTYQDTDSVRRRQKHWYGLRRYQGGYRLMSFRSQQL